MKILRLKDNTRVEILIELIKSKICTELCNMAMKKILPHTMSDFVRLPNLDNRVEKLTDQVSYLVTAKSRESNQIFCNF